MKQKVIKIGSSIGVVIPKPVAEELGFRAGQEISLYPDKLGKNILISHESKAEDLQELIKLLRWTNEFVDNNRVLLERLKDK
jgi:antitoxin component of MazEF toxin-antitoxin module